MDCKDEKFFERKSELINEALDEFSKKGYENASLNKILHEAGVSKGAFYYHFKNKEDLYLYLVGILIEEKKKFFKLKISEEDFDKDFFTLLKKFTDAGMEFARQNQKIYNFSQSYLLKERGTKIHDKALKKSGIESNHFFEAIIEDAYKKGDLRKDLPKDFIQRLIVYFFTHLHEMVEVDNIDGYKESIDNLIEFLKNGLKGKNEY
ncbi:TetR/AcrR family transcriptional regulator [Herbivorax sp. ANBcel31]|uniref:TetR/AcrR family transcriptional regulator n=1 Tax=Herbivorax sp. ANBcel31 TaxID=3069754 RepID=UPI0027B05ABE|nr:TetR/AcrR family transcriptional regulator [Herbivorax sp. ANBcel31]MDQ2084837.1 TetR/AcrR family transcriptional regulator [Herbivorax sp. ANBcel31]